MTEPVPARSQESATSATSATIAHFQLYAGDAGGPVSWRLLSRNNRDLGRSAVHYGDSALCLAAIADLVLRIGEFQVVVRPDGSHRWAWRLRDLSTDSLVAVAGHPFDRQVRCQQGWVQFHDAAQRAAVSPGLLLIGARRGRSPRAVQHPRTVAQPSPSEPPARATILAGQAVAPTMRRFGPRVVSLSAGSRLPAPNVDRG